MVSPCFRDARRLFVGPATSTIPRRHVFSRGKMLKVSLCTAGLEMERVRSVPPSELSTAFTFNALLVMCSARSNPATPAFGEDFWNSGALLSYCTFIRDVCAGCSIDFIPRSHCISSWGSAERVPGGSHSVSFRATLLFLQHGIHAPCYVCRAWIRVPPLLGNNQAMSLVLLSTAQAYLLSVR